MKEYKLVKLQYHKAAFSIAYPDSWYDNDKPIIFRENSLVFERLKEAGVLDLWCLEASKEEVDNHIENIVKQFMI